MSPSVIEVSAVLTRRCGAYMTAASLTADTGALIDPVRWALAALGLTPASIAAVTDADLAGVAATEMVDALLDLAEIRLLETCLTNLTAVTTRAGNVSQDFSDWAKTLQALIPRKRSDAGRRFGHLLALPLDGAGDKPVRMKAL